MFGCSNLLDALLIIEINIYIIFNYFRFWSAIMVQVGILLAGVCIVKENLAVYAQMEGKMDFVFKVYINLK